MDDGEGAVEDDVDDDDEPFKDDDEGEDELAAELEMPEFGDAEDGELEEEDGDVDDEQCECDTDDDDEGWPRDDRWSDIRSFVCPWEPFESDF
jgi:hypothetical protein